MTPIFKYYSKFTIADRLNNITGGNSTFDNTALLYRNGEGEPFQYDELALWDGGPNSFYAYYINGSTYAPTFTDKKKIEFLEATHSVIADIGVDETGIYMEYVQPTTLKAMVDVMTANTTTYRTENNEVTLNFEHRLFALDIIIKNNQVEVDKNVEEQELEVTSAVVTFEVCDGGKFYFDGDDVPSPTIITPNLTHDFGEFDVSVDKIKNLNETRKDGVTSFLFFPCESLKLSFTMEYKTRWGNIKTYTYDSITEGKDSPLKVMNEDGKDIGFQAGHKYQFILEKNNDIDEFTFLPKIAVVDEDTSTEGSWNDQDVNHTFN